MQLSKFGHSCIRFDDGGRALVIDPGSFSDAAAALAGADAVLITHEHGDHVDEPAVRAAVAANAALHIWAPAEIASDFADLEGRISIIDAGETFDAAGFTVQTFGGQHAVVHPLIPVIANVAYLIDGLVYHPGDSYTVPPVAVQTLLAPIDAPWSKLSEAIDFMIAVRAPQVFQIHDGFMNETGVGMVKRLVEMTIPAYGTKLEWLTPTATLTL